MRVLDLFCGGGGASMGYHRAGFEVVGVDLAPQPDYPFTFMQADALTTPWDWVGDFDLIHASPPCQAFSITANLARAQGKRASTLDLLTPIRRLLLVSGKPYVIENVKGAPLQDPITLCGSTFGLRVRRHRLFESNLPLVDHGPCQHREQGRPVGVYHAMGDSIPQGGKTADTLEEGRAAMGIDWLPWKSLTQAIPPEYSLWIGRQAMVLL